MVWRTALLASVALVLGAGGPGSARGLAEQSRLLVVGPGLAGDRAVWGESTGAPSELRSGRAGEPSRLLLHLSPPDDSSLVAFEDLAASRSLVALRTYESHCPPPVPLGGGRLIGRPCTWSLSVVAGRPDARPVPFWRTHTCNGGRLSSPDSLDVSGQRVALAETYETACVADPGRFHWHVVVRRAGPAGPARTLADDDRVWASQVRVAGRFVSWVRGAHVLVYDLASGSEAYRVPAPRCGVADYDLQSDGKLALVYGRCSGGTPTTTAAWYAPGSARPHVLSHLARPPEQGRSIRIAHDQVVFERTLSSRSSDLVLADLAGRVHRLARFVWPVRRRGDVDFDGKRVTWASDRIMKTRVDCPPPGQGRPCVQRVSGLTTIWMLPVPSARARAVARLPFRDVPK